MERGGWGDGIDWLSDVVDGCCGIGISSRDAYTLALGSTCDARFDHTS